MLIALQALAGISGSVLNGSHVVSLQSFVALTDTELHALTIFQYPMAVAANRAEMHEHIITAIARDKTETLTGIKPFDVAQLACGIAAVATRAAIVGGTPAR